MVNVAEHTLKDVDVVLWLVEPTTFIGAGERHIAEHAEQSKDAGQSWLSIRLIRLRIRKIS